MNGSVVVINRKRIFCVAFLFLAVFSSGCDVVYRFLQKEGAQERDLLGEVVPFERNDKVAEVQKLLKLYGYKIGKVDGILGANTRNAVVQENTGIKVSRFVDYETWETLNLFVDYGLVVDGEINFFVVQQALTNAGFDPGPVDGKPGRKTQKAIKDFQRDAGLKADGKVGFRTLSELATYLSLYEKE